MARIGKFLEKDDGSFHGSIVTLSVQHGDVRIVPTGSPAGHAAPSHRLFAGDAELGAAWRKKNAKGRAFYVLEMDDPSFAAPIQARLVLSDGEWIVIWERGDKGARR